MSVSGGFAAEWAKAQHLNGSSVIKSSVFYRNLEAELDSRRVRHGCLSLHTIPDGVSDFASFDTLGFAASGAIREAFMDELARNPDFMVTPLGTRLAYGNTAYLEALEREIAALHGSETSLVMHTGGVANGAILTSIPRPGDAILYDEYIHASIHDGMKNSLALVRKSFRHNNVDSFVENLLEIRASQPLIRDGARCVLVAVEGIYSMDGDFVPLRELIEAAKEVFPDGNVQFYVDEVWSTGNVGPKGTGLVCALGLEHEIAIRLHSFAKGTGANGAVIMCNNTVKAMLLNGARSLMFSGGPSFPLLAAVRAAYTLLRDGKAEQAQARMEQLMTLFRDKMMSHPIWDAANDAGIMSVPLWNDDEESQPFTSPICPVWTRPNTRHHLYLAFHLELAGFITYPIMFPVVPKGTERIRLVFHASQTDAEVEALAACICGWAEEMLEIEDQDGGGGRLPKAASQIYAIIDKQSLTLSN